MTDDTESADITPSSGEVTAAQMFAAIDWDARLRSAVEKTVAKRSQRLEERNVMNERRNYGKAAYHAAKLQRSAEAATDERGDR